MPNHIVNVGAVELISLNDNLPVRSPLVAFPHTTIEQWREYPELMADQENAQQRWGSLAIRSSGQLIIVDTGMQGEGCYLLDDMKSKGIDPEAVDLVVFTHVHPDRNCSDLRGSAGHPACYRREAKYGIADATQLDPLKREQLLPTTSVGITPTASPTSPTPASWCPKRTGTTGPNPM